MTKEKAVELLQKAKEEANGDCEELHSRMDGILLNFLDIAAPEVSAEYRRIREKASWWAYA